MLSVSIVVFINKIGGIIYGTTYVPSVQCAGLLDVQGASQNVIGRHSGILRKTEGHSFGDHLISESVSIAPSSITEAAFYSALFCVFTAHVRYNLEQGVFIYDCHVKKYHTNCA
jgi:hypothetical protein